MQTQTIRANAVRPVIHALENRMLLAYVAVTGINDLVYDPSRHIVYATTSSGAIQRYDIASGTLLTPWDIGGNLLGADITPDNAFLYVADYSDPQIRKVDLSNGTSTPLTYSPASGESNAYDVAIVGSRAIFTTEYSGSGWTPLRDIDLATGAITTRTDLSSVRQRSILSRAANGSALFLTESNISSGPIHYYETAQNKFTRSASTETSLTNTLHDVSRDGKLVALRFGGTSLYDQTLTGLLTLVNLDGGMKFDPARDILYAINSTTDQLVGYDTQAKVQRFSVALGRNLSSGSQYGSGMMAVGDNKAFISDDAGILVLDLPQATGQAAQVQLSGYYRFARRGVAGTLRLQVLDPAGFPAVNYRGTVTFTSTDPAAALPANYTFTAGDQGYIELPVTLNTPGTQSITVRDVASGTLTAQLTSLQVHAGNPALIPVTDRREHVFDPKRNRLYISTSRGVIERYDLATETLLEPLPVGSNLYGIDISADNRWLVAQEGASTGTGGQYLKVDLDLLDSSGLQSSYLTRILYTNYSLERGGWDIARTVRGTFAADGQFAGSGWVPVRDINPLTDAAPNMPAFNSVRQDTGIGRSPDGRYLIYTESNISSGPVTVFDAQTNQVVSSVNTDTFLSGESSAVNRDGTLFAVDYSGSRIFTRSLQVVTTLSSIDGGAAFDPISDVFYGVNSSTDQLVVYRTADWSVVNSVALGENVSGSSAMGSGVMSVAVNGGIIFLSTPAGVRAYTLDTRALLGNQSVSEGATALLAGNAVAAPGRTIASYEWDFNYDGATFTPDASGQNASFSAIGLDGPSTRQIALRVTDSSGKTSVAGATLSILNAPPAASFSSGGSVAEGSSGVVTFLSPSDPSPADVSAGFLYSYDFDNDGAFETTASASNTATVPAGYLSEGPGMRTIRGRIQDRDGGFRDYTTEIAIINAAPTATVSNSGPVNEGSPATLSFSNALDRSPTDTAAGFTYSYDIDNDGVFEITGSTLPAAKIPAAFLYDGPGAHTVIARIYDKDGAWSEYLSTVSVTNVAPTAAFASAGPVNDGNAATVGFTGMFDPSIVDTAAGFRFSYDFNNDGDFTDPGDIQNTASPSGSFQFPGSGSYVVTGRIMDRDGASRSYTATVIVNNNAPIGIALSNTAILENQPAGTPVGVVSGTDPDSGQSTTLTFNLVSGYGDCTLFTIDPVTRQLKTAATFDYESKCIYSIMIRCTDAGTPPLTYDEVFAVSITNVVEQTKIWTGAVSNDWSNPGNWNENQAPVAGDQAIINGGVARVTVDLSKVDVTLNGGRLDVRDVGVFRTRTLSISPAASIDLNDNDLVVNNASFSTLRALVQTGYSATPDATKKGIISTTSQNSGTTILALFDNALVGLSEWPAGSGQTVSPAAIIGKYTFFGDADFNGMVTGDDYLVLDANLNTAPPAGIAWLTGDLNFDGSVTGDDYQVINASPHLNEGNPLAPAIMAAREEPLILSDRLAPAVLQ